MGLPVLGQNTTPPPTIPPVAESVWKAVEFPFMADFQQRVLHLATEALQQPDSQELQQNLPAIKETLAQVNEKSVALNQVATNFAKASLQLAINRGMNPKVAAMHYHRFTLRLRRILERDLNVFRDRAPWLNPADNFLTSHQDPEESAIIKQLRNSSGNGHHDVNLADEYAGVVRAKQLDFAISMVPMLYGFNDNTPDCIEPISRMPFEEGNSPSPQEAAQLNTLWQDVQKAHTEYLASWDKAYNILPSNQANGTRQYQDIMINVMETHWEELVGWLIFHHPENQQRINGHCYAGNLHAGDKFPEKMANSIKATLGKINPAAAKDENVLAELAGLQNKIRRVYTKHLLFANASISCACGKDNETIQREMTTFRNYLQQIMWSDLEALSGKSPNNRHANGIMTLLPSQDAEEYESTAADIYHLRIQQMKPLLDILRPRAVASETEIVSGIADERSNTYGETYALRRADLFDECDQAWREYVNAWLNLAITLSFRDHVVIKEATILHTLTLTRERLLLHWYQHLLQGPKG